MKFSLFMVALFPQSNRVDAATHCSTGLRLTAAGRQARLSSILFPAAKSRYVQTSILFYRDLISQINVTGTSSVYIFKETALLTCLFRSSRLASLPKHNVLRLKYERHRGK